MNSNNKSPQGIVVEQENIPSFENSSGITQAPKYVGVVRANASLYPRGVIGVVLNRVMDRDCSW